MTLGKVSKVTLGQNLRDLRVGVKVGSGSARDPQRLRSLLRYSGMPSILLLLHSYQTSILMSLQAFVICLSASARVS